MCLDLGVCTKGRVDGVGCSVGAGQGGGRHVGGSSPHSLERCVVSQVGVGLAIGGRRRRFTPSCVVSET